jgi:tRNA threonylcarbamoyl adenosine modification protein YeaZ
VDARRHAEVLASAVAATFRETGRVIGDVRAIAVGVGPGAFTGLRVGIASAQAMGDAHGVPVHGVLTLDAMAYASDVDGPFAAVIDARRKELFWATYDSPMSRTSEPAAAKPQEIVGRTGNLPVIGAQATPFADLFANVQPPSLPSAGSLGQLAHHRLVNNVAMLVARPVYLRRPDTTPPSAPKSVLT